MTITAAGKALLDDGTWSHSTFMVTLGESYSSYLDVVKNAQTDELYGTATSPQLHPAMSTMLSNVSSDGVGTSSNNAALPTYVTKRNCRDTSLGGNDAINPYPQFCEDDDIAHPYTSITGNNVSGMLAMGRVYSESINDLQQILYVCLGVPVFNNLRAFYSTSVSSSLSALMNSGAGGITADNLGRLLGSSISAVVKIPVIPALFLGRILNNADKIPVTKYYDFKSQMPLYYRLVQTILVHIGTNVGIMDTDYQSALNNILGTGDTSTNPTGTGTNAAGSGNYPGSPEFAAALVMDINKINMKRALYEQAGVGAVPTQDLDVALMKQAQAEYTDPLASSPSQLMFNNSFLNGFLAAYKNTLYDSNLYIGFRIDKTTDSQESLSNQTGQSEVARTINDKMQQAKQARFTMGGGVGNILNGLADFMKGVVDTTAGAFGLDGISAALTNSGMIDIPDTWTDSSFTKTYNFNMSFHAPYGDPLTIMQSLYVPLACLLGMGLPRATGSSSYTAPFVLRAYCKGMFAVPLGIVDNMTITRGSDTHGWAMSRLPTKLNVSFSIKDLSSAMYMALGSPSQELSGILGANSSMNEYLMTLGAMGVQERTLFYPALIQKMKTLLGVASTTYASGAWLGSWAGSKILGPIHMITNIKPSTTFMIPK